MVLVIASVKLFGQSQYCEVDLQAGGPLTCSESEFATMVDPLQSPWDFSNLSVENMAKLYIDRENLPYTADAFTITATIDLEGYTEADAVILQTNSSHPMVQIGQVVLDISYDPASGAIEKEQHAYLFQDYYKLKGTLSNINFQTGGGLTLAQVSQYVHLRLGFDVDRVFDASTAYTGTPLCANASNGDIAVSWSPYDAAHSYDLEWTWVDAELPTSTEILFDNNASRVRLPAGVINYQIPTIYDKGYVVFRIRANVRCGTNYAYQCPQAWSYNDASAVTISGISALGSAYYDLSTAGHQGDLNWSAGAVFAEDGRMKVSISYADGLMKHRQSLARSNGENVTVSESIYDHLGREAISVLPVPATTSSIGFITDFTMNNNGAGAGGPKPYSWQDFELHDPTVSDKPVPAPMSNNSGAAQYYSANTQSTNDHAGYLPDANGYPYVAIQFSNDPTALTETVGGVGEAHRIGAGRESTVQYDRADENTLIGLFGINAGYGEKYTEITTTDPNGQQTFQILNPSGQVVASGLTGEAPSNLRALNDGTDITFEDIDLMVGNRIGLIEEIGHSTLNYKVRVWETDNYQFTYNFQPESFDNYCQFLTDFCYNCVYDFSLTITDKQGNVLHSTSETFGPEDYEDAEYDPDCNNSPLAEQVGLSLQLDAGEYYIEKVLKLNQEASEYYADKYIENIEQNYRSRKALDPENEACYKAYDDFLDEEISAIDFGGCFYDCEDCQEELAGLDPASDEYANLELICSNMCSGSVCENSYNMLIADLLPGGQYMQYGELIEDPNNAGEYIFDYADFFDGSAHSDFPLSMLNVKNKLPQAQLLDGTTEYVNYSYRTPVGDYLNEDGSKSYVLIEGEWLEPEDLSVADFVTHFKRSWADALLPYHPEYLYYEMCLSLDATNGSNDFDEAMLAADGYQEAYDNGWLNPLQQTGLIGDLDNTSNSTFTNGDPFFATGGLGNHLRTEFENTLTDFMDRRRESGYYDLWEAAWLMSNGTEQKNADDLNTFLDDYYLDVNADPFPNLSDVDDCDLALLNKTWRYFRMLYLAEKAKLVQEWQRKSALELTQFNGCIGREKNDYISDKEMHAELIDWASSITMKPQFKLLGSSSYYNYKRDNNQTCYISGNRLDLFANKQRRFASDVLTDLGFSGEARNSIKELRKELEEKAGEVLDNECEEQCEVNATSWLAELVDCYEQSSVYNVNDPWQEGNTTYDDLKDIFKGICESDCNWENGYKGSTTGSYMGYKNLEEAVVAFLDGSDCALSAERLRSFDNAPGITTKSYLDACGCDVLAENAAKFQDLKDCGQLGSLTEAGLLARDYGIYVDNLYELKCACGTTLECDLQELRIPVPEELTCNTCITCHELKDLVDRFYAEFKGLISNAGTFFDFRLLNENQRIAFAEYANERLGFNFSPWQYEEFIECCEDGCDVGASNSANRGLKWLEIMNEVVDAGNSTPSSFLNSGVAGAESNNNCTLSRFDDLYAEMNLIHSPTVIANPNIWLATSMKTYTYNSYQSSPYDKDIPQGLYGFFYDITATGASRNLLMFRLEPFEHKASLSSTSTSQGGFEFDDIEEFLTARSFSGLGKHQLLLTAKLDANKYDEPVVTLLLTVYPPSSVTNTDLLKMHDCESESSITAEIKDFTEAGEGKISWELGDEPDQDVEFSHYTGSAQLAYRMAYLASCSGSRSDADYIDEVQDYLDQHHNGAIVSVNECDGDCSDCGSGKFSLCEGTTETADALKSAINMLVTDAGGSRLTESSLDGIQFTLSANPLLAYEVDDSFLPESCDPGITTTNYFFEEQDDVAGTLSAYMQFDGCTDCQIELSAEVENFDFNHITAVTNIDLSPSKPGGDPSKNFVLTVTTSTGYCLGAGSLSSTTVKIYGYSDCWDITDCEEIKLICDDYEYPQMDNPCYAGLIETATLNAERAYADYISALRQEFLDNYTEHCLLNNNSETFTTDIRRTVEQVTLYYYDQAGNLVRTVAPKGVSRICSTGCTGQIAAIRDCQQTGCAGNSATYQPGHTYVTDYKYNSQGNLIQTESPDGGVSNFYYDEVGRLLFSQNAKQKTAHAGTDYEDFTYNIYDDLARIEEVGQVKVDVLSEPVNHQTVLNTTSLNNMLSGAKEQVTKTFYDTKTTKTAVHTKLGYGQRNLHLFTSYTKYREDGVPDDTDYDHASYYSYDITGNIEALVQDIPELSVLGQDLKLITYDFDLISGNTNQVNYQEGEADQYFHRYVYNAHEQLSSVQTSFDGVLWTEDTRREYYDHGMLARKELGGLRVQGMDYAYTLHGWLKAMNGNIDERGQEMGGDGIFTSGSNTYDAVANDAFGFVLGYYDESIVTDYTAVNQNRQFIANIVTGFNPTNQYDGNIGYMSINQTATMGNLGVMHQRYEYDQLKRLYGMSIANGVSNNGGTYDWSGTTVPDYRTAYSYDANGNISSLYRNGAANVNLGMDNLSYQYQSGTNQLQQVSDNVSYTANYSNDFDDMSGAGHTYTYDPIGNLNSDLSAEIQEIDWGLYGNVKKIVRTSGSTKADLEYTYDIDGLRLSKTVKNGTTATDWKRTYYVRDVAGNVMATYSSQLTEAAPGEYNIHHYLEEQHLYGSARLGVKSQQTELYNKNFQGTLGNGLLDYTVSQTLGEAFASVDADYKELERGNLLYELVDHLGNVRSTISDRKLPQWDATHNAQYFTPDIASAQDYYPFGSLMPERQYSNSNFTRNYNFGFNTMERDDEIYGEGNSYDLGLRHYDPRIGRMFSIDPRTSEYPWQTPYAYHRNSPVYMIDYMGGGNPPDRKGGSFGEIIPDTDGGGYFWNGESWNHTAGVFIVTPTLWGPDQKQPMIQSKTTYIQPTMNDEFKIDNYNYSRNVNKIKQGYYSDAGHWLDLGPEPDYFIDRQTSISETVNVFAWNARGMEEFNGRNDWLRGIVSTMNSLMVGTTITVVTAGAGTAIGALAGSVGTILVYNMDQVISVDINPGDELHYGAITRTLLTAKDGTAKIEVTNYLRVKSANGNLTTIVSNTTVRTLNIVLHEQHKNAISTLEQYDGVKTEYKSFNPSASILTSGFDLKRTN